MELKSYSIQNDTNDGVADINKLQQQIIQSGSVNGFTGVTIYGDSVTVNGTSITSEEDLDGVISAHNGTPTEEEQQSYQRQILIKERIEFCQDMMQRFKEKNLTDGINATQGFWLQHRMRALPVTFYGINYTLDLLNMVVSGDVELGCLAMMYCELDDMTQPYHWLNETRRTWLVTEMKTFLGWP